MTPDLLNATRTTPAWRFRAMAVSIAFCSMLASATSMAADDHRHDRGDAGESREMPAHEHGHGTLDIVVEGEALQLTLQVPAVHVVGFEHAPGNDAERARLADALADFSKGAAMFEPSEKARCELERADVAMPGMDKDASGHAELQGQYEFHCHAPAGLQQIRVSAFTKLMDIDELDVRLVTEEFQTARVLMRNDPVVDVTGSGRAR